MSDRLPITSRMRRGLVPDAGETTLGEVAKVLGGYAFRSRVTDDPDGDVRVLQLGDIDAQGHVDPETLTRMEFGKRAGKHTLEPDDVLLTARGERVLALRVPGADPIVAAAGLLVIRPKAVLDSDYLCWCLNHPRTRQRLERLREGSNLKFLERGNAEGLPIAVPEMAVQHEIAGRHAEQQQRSALRLALNALDERIIDETNWQRARRSVAAVTDTLDNET